LDHNLQFGSLLPAVIWTDTRHPDGSPIVDIDPDALVKQINSEGFPLLLRHDPGRPQGKLLVAKTFADSDGKKFVAAVLALYQGGTQLSFADMAVDTTTEPPPPKVLPSLTTNWAISFATDAREVEAEWVEDAIRNAPISVKQVALSHNAADQYQELIRIGLLFVTLVWNPFVTAVATEGGKDFYAAVRRWLKELITKLAERRNPILDVQAHHGGCQVSFLFRGKDIEKNAAALERLSLAALQAHRLIAQLKSANAPPRVLVYEYDAESDKWLPSFAELRDGRFICNDLSLFAAEEMPAGLSLGLIMNDHPENGR
jgi:hypothetical protein